MLATDVTTTDEELGALTRQRLPIRTFGGLRYRDTTAADFFRVLFILGGPGAGKGTQSELMADYYPVAHLSVGELLREEQDKPDSPHADSIKQALVAGQIVPVEVSLGLLRAAMEAKAQEMGRDTLFLVDGFPRNFDNLSGWCRIMRDVADLWAVLYYQCPLEVLERRILERGKDSGRADDNLASVKKRFATFEQNTLPVIETLRRASIEAGASWSVIDIRGDQSLEDVWLSTQQVLNQLLLHDVLTANAALLKAVETGDQPAYERLCSPDCFGSTPVAEYMRENEGSGDPIGEIGRAQVDVVSGRHVAVAYDRVLQGLKIREKRIWSHMGPLGWRNVHFSRLPLQ